MKVQYIVDWIYRPEMSSQCYTLSSIPILEIDIEINPIGTIGQNKVIYYKRNQASYFRF